MAENRTEVLAGAIVLAVAVGFGVFAARTGGIAGNDSDSYSLTASFRSVQGISVGTDVKMAGVRIGQITGLELNPETFRADASFTVQGDLLLPDDSAILVSSEGLLGGNYIEVLPGGSPFNLSPGEEILDTQGAISLVTLLMRFVGSASDAQSGGEN